MEGGGGRHGADAARDGQSEQRNKKKKERDRERERGVCAHRHGADELSVLGDEERLGEAPPLAALVARRPVVIHLPGQHRDQWTTSLSRPSGP